jgi:hypothetical protein
MGKFNTHQADFHERRNQQHEIKEERLRSSLVQSILSSTSDVADVPTVLKAVEQGVSRPVLDLLQSMNKQQTVEFVFKVMRTSDRSNHKWTKRELQMLPLTDIKNWFRELWIRICATFMPGNTAVAKCEYTRISYATTPYDSNTHTNIFFQTMVIRRIYLDEDGSGRILVDVGLVNNNHQLICNTFVQGDEVLTQRVLLSRRSGDRESLPFLTPSVSSYFSQGRAEEPRVTLLTNHADVRETFTGMHRSHFEDAVLDAPAVWRFSRYQEPSQGHNFLIIHPNASQSLAVWVDATPGINGESNLVCRSIDQLTHRQVLGSEPIFVGELAEISDIGDNVESRSSMIVSWQQVMATLGQYQKNTAPAKVIEAAVSYLQNYQASLQPAVTNSFHNASPVLLTEQQLADERVEMWHAVQNAGIPDSAIIPATKLFVESVCRNLLHPQEAERMQRTNYTDSHVLLLISCDVDDNELIKSIRDRSIIPQSIELKYGKRLIPLAQKRIVLKELSGSHVSACE